MKEIMKIYQEMDSVKKMAKLVSKLEREYIEYTYTNPGKYREHHTYGSKTVNGKTTYYVEWTAWKIES